MGLLLRYIDVDRKTGRLSFRRVFPSRLRRFVPGQKRELKVSLQSDKLDDPDTLRLYSKSSGQYDRILELAEKASSGVYDRLDAATIDYLAEAFRVEALEMDEAARWDAEERALYSEIAEQTGVTGQFEGAEGTRWSSKRRETLEASIAQSRALLGAGDMEGILKIWTWEIDQFAFSKGLRLDTCAPQFAALCRQICRSALDASEVNLARLNGEQIETPEAPIRPRSERSQSSKPAPETMTTLAEKLVAQRADPVGHSTQQSWNTALRFWRDVHGELACEAITRRNVTDWLQLLAQKPTGIPRRLDVLSLPALVERYADDKAVGRLSGKTVRQHLGSLSAIWNKAESAGYIEGLANPFARHSVRVQQKAGGNPFTMEELNAIFRLPVFTEGERPTRGRGEASFWKWACITGSSCAPGTCE
jgi:hypothetical protein